MDKIKVIVFRFLIVFLSLLFTDGGRSFSLASDNIKVILTHEHSADYEVPHQHYSVNLSADEKWIDQFLFDFSCHNNSPINFQAMTEKPSGDFSDSVWQPPKQS